MDSVTKLETWSTTSLAAIVLNDEYELNIVDNGYYNNNDLGKNQRKKSQK